MPMIIVEFFEQRQLSNRQRQKRGRQEARAAFSVS
jgi:hypothetical protein